MNVCADSLIRPPLDPFVDGSPGFYSMSVSGFTRFRSRSTQVSLTEYLLLSRFKDASTKLSLMR